MRFTNPAAVLAAAENLLDNDPEMWYDNAAAFSCSEADALADLFRAADDKHLAETFIQVHAAGDDEGDSHFGMDQTE